MHTLTNMVYFFKKYLTIIVIVLVIAVVIGIYVFLEAEDRAFEEKHRQEQEKELINYLLELKDVQAKSFYVYDLLKNEEIFSKNQHERLPLASLTKLMSGLVAFNILPDTATVRIGAADIAQEGDSGLFVGEEWRLKDLIEFSLITSSNDGIHALASVLDSYEKENNKSTVNVMNTKAEALGLTDTVFLNSSGLDLDGNISGAYSSSHDVAMLVSYIWENSSDIILKTKNQEVVFISESNIKHRAVNTNVSVNNIPSILASKTGFTDLAGGNLAIIFDAGFMHPVVAVVLGSTQEGRFSDMEKLVKVALEKLSN